ncbi:MAG: molybdenum cofactor biosynthesis protein B [Pyrinomonadaceae bacterium]
MLLSTTEMGDGVEIRAAVVTASDSRSIEEDLSGQRLAELLVEYGARVSEHVVVADDLEEIAEKLRTYADRQDIDLIVTSGGTGLGPRDNTPEATLSVIEREAPGIVEAMRLLTIRNTPKAMLSRGVAGIRNGTLIINLPGSPRGVEECFAVLAPVLRHAVAVVKGNTEH